MKSEDVVNIRKYHKLFAGIVFEFIFYKNTFSSGLHVQILFMML